MRCKSTTRNLREWRAPPPAQEPARADAGAAGDAADADAAIQGEDQCNTAGPQPESGAAAAEDNGARLSKSTPMAGKRDALLATPHT